MGSGIRIEASGHLRDRPFELTASGGPLLDLDDPRKPYPLEASLALGDTSLGLDGTITRALQLAAVDLRLHAAGPDPARLWYLLAVTLPHLPPYDLTARLVFEGDAWEVQDIDGTIGDSDLAGHMQLALQAGAACHDDLEAPVADAGPG